MTNCKYITKNGRCGLKGSYAYRHGCFGEDMCRCREPMTNADRIRTMSDEELAEQFVFMSTICEFCVKRKNCEEVPGYKYCMEGILDWLQQPAEEDGHER